MLTRVQRFRREASGYYGNRETLGNMTVTGLSLQLGKKAFRLH